MTVMMVIIVLLLMFMIVIIIDFILSELTMDHKLLTL